jgi:hypothetical protein
MFYYRQNGNEIDIFTRNLHLTYESNNTFNTHDVVSLLSYFPIIVCPNTRIEYAKLTEDEKRFLATVAGEGLSVHLFEYKAISSAIINRHGFAEWRNLNWTQILNTRAFHAVDGDIFRAAMDYINTGEWNNYSNIDPPSKHRTNHEA